MKTDINYKEQQGYPREDIIIEGKSEHPTDAMKRSAGEALVVYMFT